MLTKLLTFAACRLPRPMLDWLKGLRYSKTPLGRLINGASERLKHSDAVVVVARGEGAGLRIRTKGVASQYVVGIAEPEIQASLKQCLPPGGTFYDIGANIGFFSLVGSRLVGPQGKVFSFEPMPQCVAQTREHAQLNGLSNITVFEVAVSSRSGTERLLLGRETTWNKLESTGDAPYIEGQILVQTITIDGLAAQEKLPPPDFIKIDVEGAEVDVLKGMAETIRTHRPVIVCQAHSTNEPLAATLAEFGYWQIVLEEPDKTLPQAATNANVLAGPPEKRAVMARMRDLLGAPRTTEASELDEPVLA